MKKIVSFAMGLFAACLSLSAQNITVSGVVTDASNGEAVIMCAVIQVGTTNATFTDVNGYYFISDIPINAVLKYETVGYEVKYEPVNGRHFINVQLKYNGAIITPSSLYAGIRFSSVMDSRKREEAD